jgi:branched-chain amino acid transport system ATP-binding protein
LDEPAAGMNPTEKVRLMELIRFVRDKFRIAVLLVEHDMRVVMGVCQRIVVLDHGHKIAEGTPTAIQQNPKVIEAYLGGNLSMLELRDLHVGYGGIAALHGISSKSRQAES